MSGAQTTSRVELSEAAARRIAGILAKEAPGAVFRVGVDGGGCSGFKYSFAVDPAPGSNDLLLEQGAARLGGGRGRRWPIGKAPAPISSTI